MMSCRVCLRSATALLCASFVVTGAQGGTLIDRVCTDCVRYEPGETAVITVHLDNQTGGTWQGVLELDVSHRGATAYIARQEVAPLAPGGTGEVVFNWTTPPLDYRGYFVEVRAGSNDRGATAIDVSSDWTRFPRYGYVTEFYDGQSASQSEAMIAQLAEDYHINSLQFYDWMWRHENVVHELRPGVIADPWEDWRGEMISFDVLADLIAAGHDRNIACMPYFQIYGARENYDTYSGVSQEWGIYAMPDGTNQHSHNLNGGAGIWLYLFDPGNTLWQDHLVSEYSRAITMLDFDGIHLDQVGEKSPVYDWSGGPVDLASGSSFRLMIDRTRLHLDTLEAQTSPAFGHLATTFNLVGGAVNGWGMPNVVSDSPTDFLYAEVWQNETYQGVIDFIDWARDESNRQAVVLAAYMNYYESFPQFNEPSVRLADAVFAVGGAHHIELGDGDHMLAHEFFPSIAKTPSSGLLNAMKDYYRFIAAHENVLFDRELESVDNGSQWLTITGQPVSGTPTGGAIWVTRRRLDNCDALHLVNLLGNDSSWRNAANVPPTCVNLPVTYRLGASANVASVHVASPDIDGGLPAALEFQAGTDATSSYISFTIPQLQYWDTVLIRRNPAAPAGDRYEAEDAVKTNVAVDDDHAGYSGLGFVDQFDGGNDGVSFEVCVPADGSYDLDFRYANALGVAATRNIYVDGEQAGQVTMPALSNWDTWGTATLNVSLTAGTRQVVIGFGGQYAINLDYLEVSTPSAGLRGQYFDTAQFADPVFTRVDPQVDFDWGTGAPDPAMDADEFTVRWSGRVTAPVSGEYTFFTQSDDGVRLFVDDQLLVDHWASHALSEDSGAIELTAGESYDLVLVYREQTGDAIITLLWEAPGVAKQIVSATYLAPVGCEFDAQPPSTPTTLTAIDVTSTGVELLWNVSVDDVALAGYAVMQDGVEALRTSVPTAFVGGLTSGESYVFSVRAFDVFGNVSADSTARIVAVTGNPLRGDIDLDGDVDLDDFAGFADCFRGPLAMPAPTGLYGVEGCLRAFDADDDGNIDLVDYRALQIAMFTSQP